MIPKDVQDRINYHSEALNKYEKEKKIKKYPAPCGLYGNPGHENHNCKRCANNKDGCPENCHYWQCYAGYECHFKPE